MVTLLVIGLWQHVPIPNICAPTPQDSICVCITSHQETALVVHRGWSVSVTLTPQSQPHSRKIGPRATKNIFLVTSVSNYTHLLIFSSYFALYPYF
jgi:hypothetical protein